MALNDKKRIYWLKLRNDFFKTHEVRIVESMPNGKDYIIFYLKLLCESSNHAGYLRFSQEIPYDENMLSVITDTNIDIVRSAIALFSKLNLLEVLDDGTFFFNKVEEMIGSETISSIRQREYRNTKMVTSEGQSGDNVTLLSQKCHTIVTPSGLQCRRDIDIDIDIEKENNTITNNNITNSIKEKTNKFVKPTIEDIKKYCLERKNNVDANRFYDFYESKNWMIGKNKMKDWKACVRTWEQRDSTISNDAKVIQENKQFENSVTENISNDVLDELKRAFGGN